MKYMRKQLLEDILYKNADELKNQIGILKKLLGVTKISHENRTKQLRDSYGRLWNQTEDFRQKIFEIRLIMDSI